MKYDIFICNLDRSKIWQLPILPEEMPDLKRASENEIFKGWDGDYNLINPVGLGSFTLERWLPAKGRNYYFQRVKNFDSDNFILFMDIERLYRRPIRVIFSRSDGTDAVNETFSIDEFNWHENKVGNYVYFLKCTQWRELK